jgi:hypothetical protein
VKYFVLFSGLGLVAYLLYRGVAWSFTDPTPPYKVWFDKSKVRWDHDRWIETDDDEERRRRESFGAMGNP